MFGPIFTLIYKEMIEIDQKINLLKKHFFLHAFKIQSFQLIFIITLIEVNDIKENMQNYTIALILRLRTTFK